MYWASRCLKYWHKDYFILHIYRPIYCTYTYYNLIRSSKYLIVNTLHQLYKTIPILIILNTFKANTQSYINGPKSIQQNCIRYLHSRLSSVFIFLPAYRKPRVFTPLVLWVVGLNPGLAQSFLTTKCFYSTFYINTYNLCCCNFNEQVIIIIINPLWLGGG